eukprot:5120603-Prymnesium_polylepis.2
MCLRGVCTASPGSGVAGGRPPLVAMALSGAHHHSGRSKHTELQLQASGGRRDPGKCRDLRRGRGLLRRDRPGS